MEQHAQGPEAGTPSAEQNRLKLELWQLDLRYDGFRIRTPGRQGRILASLAEHGQQSPVLVVAAPAPHYVLIDGYRRVEALQKLGNDTVEALLLPMSEAEALVYGLREARGARRSALEEAWWIRELVERHRFNLDRIAVSLERSKSWVSRRLALVKQLPEPVQTLVRRGKLCPHAAMRYLVPLARANKGACGRLAEQIGKARLSARQMGKLYMAWQRADRKERSRLEENPLLFLKAIEALERDPAQKAEQPKTMAGNLFKDLEILTRICQRIRQALHQGICGEAGPSFARKLEKRWQETRLAFDSVKETIEEMVHAGHGRTQGDL